MCNDGRCGNFDPTRSLRFLVPADRMQPRIPGIKLPRAGIFVDANGTPLVELDKSGKAESVQEMLSGYHFSRASALSRAPGLKVRGEVGRGTVRRLKAEINESSLPEIIDLSDVERDFTRPMLDDAARTSGKALAVWRKGQPIRYGKHPMAGLIASQFGGIQVLERMRIEGQIMRTDELRLRDTLLTDQRFARMPVSDPTGFTEMSDMLLEITSVLQPPEGVHLGSMLLGMA